MKSNTQLTKSGKFNKLTTAKSFSLILLYLPSKYTICFLPTINKEIRSFILSQLPPLKPILSSLQKQIPSQTEYKSLLFNHSSTLETQLKDISEDKYSLYRSLYIYPSILFKSLSSLDLQKQNIGIDGVLMLLYYIKNTLVLSSLNLSYNNIRDKGVALLSSAIALNTSISTLSLECNGIGDRGAAMLGTGIKKHKGISTIKLALNVITIEGVMTMTETIGTNESIMCKNLKIIDVKYNNIVIEKEKEKELQKYTYLKK